MARFASEKRHSIVRFHGNPENFPVPPVNSAWQINRNDGSITVINGFDDFGGLSLDRSVKTCAKQGVDDQPCTGKNLGDISSIGPSQSLAATAASPESSLRPFS